MNKVLPTTGDGREKKGYWCPGRYIFTCLSCGVVAMGHKQASSCAPCAYGDTNNGKSVLQTFTRQEKEVNFDNT